MPIANPSPTPLATLRAHVSLPLPPTPFRPPSLVLHRLLPPPTSLLRSIRPLLAGAHPGLRRTAPFESPRSRPPYTPWYRHILCELPLSPFLPLPSPRPLLADPPAATTRALFHRWWSWYATRVTFIMPRRQCASLYTRESIPRDYTRGKMHEKERTVFPVYKIFHEVPIKILRVYRAIFQFSLQQIFHLTFIRENFKLILFYIE